MPRPVTRGRGVRATAYLLLLLSCDSPLAPGDASLQRIEVSPPSLAMMVGESRPLTARLLDEDGSQLTGRRPHWASQNPAVASVSQEGIVTAIAAGATQVAVSASGKSAIVPIAVAARPVTLVRVTPSTATVQVGRTITLAAEALDASGGTINGRPVTWSSNSAAIATVSAAGVVTGVASGNVTIAARVDGISGAAVVSVQDLPVASLQLSSASSQLQVGRSVQLTATPRDAAGNALAGRIVVWSSSNDAIATVSSTGLIVGIAPGSAVITARSEGVSVSHNVTVSSIAVATVSIVPNSATLQVGATATLSLVLRDAGGTILSPSGRTITWTSGTPSVATVTSGGVVTAIAPGSATIRVVADTASATAAVTVVNVPVASVSVAPTTATLTQGATLTLVATARDAAGNELPGRPFAWSSNNSAVATVNVDGIVTAVGAGSAAISATSGGVSGSATVSVTTVPIATIGVTPSTNAIVVGATRQLTATARDASNNVLTGRTILWNSSASSVASVSSSGLVTAVGAGTATITASSPGSSATGTATVSVTLAPVEAVAVVPNNSTTTAGSQVAYAVTLTGTGGTPLTTSGRTVAWSSSNTAVATIHGTTGVATANGAGTTTITATVTTPGQSSPVSGATTLAVSAVPVHSVQFGAFAGTLHVGAAYARVITATTRDAGGNVLAGREILWSSSDPSVTVSVQSSTNGQTTLTAVSGTGGATDIIARASGASGFVADTITVTTDLVPITSSLVALSPSSQPDSVVVGGSRVYAATARDSAGNALSGVALGGRTPAWSTGGSGSASLSAAGATATVTGSGSGPVTVQAGYGAGTTAGSATLRVLVPVAAVNLVVSPDSFLVGGSAPITATAVDAGNQPVAGRTITLSSGTPAVASVGTTSGTQAISTTVTGVGAPGGRGTSVITASVPLDGRTAAVTVKVLAPVATVSVAPGSATIPVGGTTTATATLRDAANNVLAGRAVTWSSSNSSVATVSASGVVTGVGSGGGGSAQVTITASETLGGQSGSTTITVQEPVASVTISAPRTGIRVSETIQTSVATLDANGNTLTGRTVTYQSSSPSVATVSATGVVTAVTAGNATITASSEGKVSSPGVAFAVTRIPIDTVVASAPSTSAIVGQTVQATVTATDSAGNVGTAGRTIVWSSSDAGIASVGTTSGLITAVSAGGPVSISVSVDGVAAAVPISFTVTVAPVNSIAITTSTATLLTGSTFTFGAKTYDANGAELTGRPITWSSSQPAVATIDANSGLATGVSAGTTTITATSEGKSANVTLTVVVPVASVVVSPATLTLATTTASGTLTATLADGGGTPLAGRACTFTSSPGGHVQLSGPAGGVSDANGEFPITVVGVAAHANVQVTVTCEGIAGTASVVVP